ncbi:MAG: histidine kinase [Paenibacillaceae bacterium]|nr:histidine kinase [Paenibacillaceae bacterium]
MERITRTSIFPKLVVAFLLVIIPLYGIGLVMNRLGESSVQDEWVNSLNARTMVYVKTLEAEKKHVSDFLSEFVNDPDLSQLSILSGIMSVYEWSEAVKRVQDKLLILTNSNATLKGASAHIVTIGRTIMNNRAIPIQNKLTDDYEAVKPQPGIDYAHAIAWQNRLFLGQSFPDGSSDPAYVLAVEFDLAELRHSLQDLVSSDQSGAELIGVNQEWAVTDTEVERYSSELRAFVVSRFGQAALEGVEKAELNGARVQIAYRYVPSFDAYLILYVPQKMIVGDISFYRTLFWLLSLLSLTVVLLYSYWIYRLIHRPLQRMIRSFRRVEDGRLEPAAMPAGNDEFRYLFLHFNKMVAKLNTLIHDNYEQQLRAKHAQIKQLQSQINPHFLYNTCYILYRLAQFGDLENISRFSRYLGDYYEFITRHHDDTISLEQEVLHTRTYLEIQHMRFTGRFEIEVADLPEENRSIRVPKLVLQPIVENAFKYALERKMSGGKLRIAFAATQTTIRITVEDNGDRMDDDTLQALVGKLDTVEQESTGMINVHRRLLLMYGDGSGITLERGEWGGLAVTLSLPLQTESEPLPERTTA